jgi:hypothetical protein
MAAKKQPAKKQPAKKQAAKTSMNQQGIADDIIKGAVKVGKAASKGAKKSVQKANPRNSYALGRAVVHGSPVKGLKKIKPQYGSAHLPDESVVWAWDPKGFGSRSGIAPYVSEYSGAKGSVYIGKVPRSSVKKRELGSGKVAVTKPMKVKREISTGDFSKLEKELNTGLLKSGAIRKPTKAGVKTRAGNVVRKTKSKTGTIARKNKTISRKLNQFEKRNSVV